MDYYRNMWARHSHTLSPLTCITSSKLKFKWTKIKQDDFDQIKRIIAWNTLSSYPYFNEEFYIHTYASYFQLGAFIIQKGEPIAFYSEKTIDTQKRYTVTEN